MAPWSIQGLQAPSLRSSQTCLEGRAGPGHQRGVGALRLCTPPRSPAPWACGLHPGAQTELASHRCGAEASDTTPSLEQVSF